MIRDAEEKDRKLFDKVARHPLQSWAWGDFRKQTGLTVSRLIEETEGKAEEVFQITWHRIPKTKFFIGYCPKSSIPKAEVAERIAEIAKKKGAIMVKFEPNERADENNLRKIEKISKKLNFIKGKSLFTKYSFCLDISKSEEEILKGMHPKTRYNTRLAEKKGVVIVEDGSEEGFEDYWKLMDETTKRQKFYAHGKGYHQKMWRAMKESGMGHLMKAVYEGKVLTTWVLLVLNGVLYYPYGASSNEGREVMPSNLMMWDAIKFGKKQGCNSFDMWGSLGPEPDIKDPWYGFHRFKMGYGPELVEFVGTYDLVVNTLGYKIYQGVDKLRWIGLKILAPFRK